MVLLLFVVWLVVAQESLKKVALTLLVSAGKYEQMAQHIASQAVQDNAAPSSSAQVGQGSFGWVGHQTGAQDIHLQADVRR